MAFQP